MKRACAASAIAAGLVSWLAWLAVPADCLAVLAPRAGQAGARNHGAEGTAGAPAAAPAGPAAPATPADQVTPPPAAPAAPPASAVWFLSAAQEQQLRRIGQAAHRWHAALAPLSAAATRQGDVVLQGELVKLDSLLRQLEAAQQLTLAAYVAALAARNQALALWADSSANFSPGDEVAWQLADAGAAELATAAETGFVFGADLSSGAVMTYTEISPGEQRGAVGDDGGSTGSESAAGGGAGDAAFGEPPSASGGAMPDTPPVAAVPEGSGDGGPMPDAGAAPPETSAGALGSGDAAVAAVVAAASSPSSGWVVVHGGPAPGTADAWPDDAPPSGDVQEQLPSLSFQEPSAGEDADAGADTNAAAVAAPALAWEEVCRPWQPGAVRPGLCPLRPAGADPF
jgi:hypothetical protein